MKKIILLLAFVLCAACMAQAQTAAEVQATAKKMNNTATPCNTGPEAFRTFIQKFNTDKEFMDQRITLPQDKLTEYAALIVPGNFEAKDPVERDQEEYYQAWGELQYNKVYLCCGYVDLYDTHTFVFTRNPQGAWVLSNIVPGE